MSPVEATPAEPATPALRDLPRGVVTFLFTDIEGSTKLWERCPGVSARALARHYGILWTSEAAHGWHVF